jgi:hypothetical protein
MDNYLRFSKKSAIDSFMGDVRVEDDIETKTDDGEKISDDKNKAEVKDSAGEPGKGTTDKETTDKNEGEKGTGK